MLLSCMDPAPSDSESFACGRQASSTLSICPASVKSGFVTSRRYSGRAMPAAMGGMPKLAMYSAAASVGPQYAIRPDAKIKVSSNRLKMRWDGWWMVQTTRMFSFLARLCNSVATSNADALSSALVGSSKTSIAGRFTNASAMQRRFFCPPDRPFRIMSPTSGCSQDFKPV
mmetsp:Transcript_34818/g.100055  ORF Transcript_34818/g.100055 Transcript_34818/m.100055 type:complete len:171 (-) Transcript_34818:610-1122(-)